MVSRQRAGTFSGVVVSDGSARFMDRTVTGGREAGERFSPPAAGPADRLTRTARRAGGAVGPVVP
ncbi:hypothetical protein GCM10010398_28250 [Streptomyces fimbriatus]